jgi:acid phosphatase type 7
MKSSLLHDLTLLIVTVVSASVSVATASKVSKESKNDILGHHDHNHNHEIFVEDIKDWKVRPYHKRFGGRSIPYETEFANEFSLISPQNIRLQHEIHEEITAASSSYVIESISPLLIDNDDVVTVSFSSNAPNSQAYGDWIGAYSPSDVDIKTTVPIKYGWCDEDPNYNSNGYGTLSFNLTNLRADIKFYYFTSGTRYPKQVNSSSDLVTFSNFNEPLRPRVVPSGDPDVFNLLWSSATSSDPRLKWGTVTGVYPNIISATTSTIEKSEMLGSPANSTGWRDLGLIHTASLSGMTQYPNQKIFYIFGDEATNDYSGEHVFHPPPLAGTQPSNRGTRVVLYDDMGRGSTDDTYTWNEYGRPSIETMYSVGHQVASGTVDAIYHGGDISYATGYLAVWDFFLDELAPSASGTLYLTTVGNHESDCPNSASYYVGSTSYGAYGDSGGECGVPTTRLLPMPQPATTNKPWYSTSSLAFLLSDP